MGQKERKISVHGETIKRTLVCTENYRAAYFSTCDEMTCEAMKAANVASPFHHRFSVVKQALRCTELVDTMPASPPEGLDTFNTPSKMYRPKWLDETLPVENEWRAENDLETDVVRLGP